MKSWKLFIGLLLIAACFAKDIPLIRPIYIKPKIIVKWNKNAEKDLAGYRVLLKNTSSESDHNVSVVDTTVTIDCSQFMVELFGNATIWVQAYDSSGNYSDYSKPDSIIVSKELYLFGDADGDRNVSTLDLVSFWMSSGSVKGMPNYNPKFDINQDGRIDVIDHIAFIINHGYREE